MPKLYDVLVALPSKSFGAVSGAVGIPAAIWPTWFEEKVGRQVTADTIQIIGIVLMAVSIIYFALLWWLKPSGDADGTSAKRVQTALGGQSSNIGSNSGTINNYYGSAPPSGADNRERRPSLSDPGVLDGLERALTGHPLGLATYKSTPKPDLPLTGLLVRVYKTLGGAPDGKDAKSAFYKRVDHEIADKISLEEVKVWGRYAGRSIEPISIGMWRRGVFDHRKKSLCIQGDAVHPMCYEDLTFNRKQIDAIWPEHRK